MLARTSRKDEPLILEFLAENLRADDYTVLTAASGSEAIDALGAARPDVVLLDVVLPDMSGYDVCRRVRQGDSVNDPWDPDLPIIMLSAKAEHTDRVRGLNRGADDYVTKPFLASGAA
jgi:DNA-binding response OmpR family regulator